MLATVCETCGGAIIRLADEPRCVACGRDPAYPGRPPTDEEKKNGSQLANIRNNEIRERFDAGDTVMDLAKRFDLSTTRIRDITRPKPRR